VYRGRRDHLLAAFAKHLPDLIAEGVAAGLHLLLRLPAGVDDMAIAREASNARIRVPALTTFRIKPSNSGGLVIGYGRLHESAIDTAIQELAKVVRSHL
jgi:GntR family transcriptional regulator/MocR family aminotransferase